MEKDALAVMVRVPVPGAVKTRLTPGFSAHEACLLYEAFLKDLFSRLSSLGSTDIFIYYAVSDGPETALNIPDASVDKTGSLSNIVPDVFTLTPQKDGDLGGRMQGVFKELFSRGYARVALIGSDSPDIPLEYLRRTFTALTNPGAGESRPLALGPALDGGYYLIAMNASLEASSASLFTGIEWGAASVLQDTFERAESAGMQVVMLPEWHDIDTCDDLAHIKGSDCLPATMLVLAGLAHRRL